MQPTSLFITGTDTGVGKTLVTALLALRLQAQGIDVGVMKPFATGCEWLAGELVNADAQFLQAMTGVEDALNLINPVRFAEPLAPLVAARRVPTYDPATLPDFMPAVREAYQELCRRHQYVLVEGVGGLLVPIQEKIANREGASSTPYFTCADLAHELGLPVVVVARRMLGTINHATLTCQVPLQPPAHFAGLIFCDAQPVEANNIAVETSADVIAEITGLGIWGMVPYLHSLTPKILKRAAQEYLTTP